MSRLVIVRDGINSVANYNFSRGWKMMSVCISVCVCTFWLSRWDNFWNFLQSTPNVKLLLGRNWHDCQISILVKIANLTLFNIFIVFRRNMLEKRCRYSLLFQSLKVTKKREHSNQSIAVTRNPNRWTGFDTRPERSISKLTEILGLSPLFLSVTI